MRISSPWHLLDGHRRTRKMAPARQASRSPRWKDPSNRPNDAGYTTVELWQVLNALPDRKHGKKDLWCAGSSGDTKDWGDRAAGEYYFAVYGAGGFYDIRTWANP